jgi:hypothetical protein
VTHSVFKRRETICASLGMCATHFVNDRCTRKCFGAEQLTRQHLENWKISKFALFIVIIDGIALLEAFNIKLTA